MALRSALVAGTAQNNTKNMNNTTKIEIQHQVRRYRQQIIPEPEMPLDGVAAQLRDNVPQEESKGQGDPSQRAHNKWAAQTIARQNMPGE